jgi:hypothetical protein
MTGDKRSKIDQEIGRAADLSGAELAANWRKMFRSPQPKGFKRWLREQASAFRIRLRTFGDPISARRKRFLAIAERGEAAKPAAPERHHCSNAAVGTSAGGTIAPRSNTHEA